jgi:hypothetical protein
LLLSAFASIAAAEEPKAKWTCQDVGPLSTNESIGDRDNHSISVSTYSCRIDSGPWAGAIATGQAIWEHDGAKHVLLSNQGVVRKPGSFAVFNSPTGELSLIMTDGKVTGMTASGTGTTLFASGGWKKLVNETWTAKGTGPGQFTLEENFE